MRHYCTLFDSNYLSRGVALYESLLKNSSQDFHLTVLTMDDECFNGLDSLNLPHVKLISLKKDFLSEDLRKIFDTRPWNEFCWTCSSALIKYCFEKLNYDQVTYLDSDIYFFNDPELIFKELQSSDSALITEHNYAPEHDQVSVSGRFCVQFVTFNNNDIGVHLLSDWYGKCLESCALDPAKGLCGDQKYLDEWPERFKGVVISQANGAGLAPWNVSKFKYRLRTGLELSISGSNFEPTIFYHFHGLKIHTNGSVLLSGSRYSIPKIVKQAIYDQYFLELAEVKKKLKKVSVYTMHGAPPTSDYCTTFLIKVKKLLKSFGNSNFNNYPLSVPALVASECPICGDDNVSACSDSLYDDRYGYPGHYLLLECNSCQHKFLNHKFVNNDLVDLYSNYYPRSQFDVLDYNITSFEAGFKGWLKGEKSSAVAWIPKNVSVLDVGCGFGESLGYHKSRNCTSVGVEADDNAQRVAKHYDLDIRKGIFDLSMFESSEKFDYITLDQVLEHSIAPKKLLEDLSGLLKPQGKIILTIPNASGVGARLFRQKWIHWHTPYHLHFFSRKSLNKSLKGAELFVEEAVTTTHSEWVFYQLIHLFKLPALGQKSKFWNDGHSKLPLKFHLVFKILRKIKILSLFTRLFDQLSMGDNLIVVLRRNDG